MPAFFTAARMIVTGMLLVACGVTQVQACAQHLVTGWDGGALGGSPDAVLGPLRQMPLGGDLITTKLVAGEGTGRDGTSHTLSSGNRGSLTSKDSNLVYEVKPSPGRGLGVFATRDIPRGTPIIVEEPSFSISTPEMVPGQGFRLADMIADIEAAFEDLDPSQQEEYLALHGYRFPAEADPNHLMVIFRSNAYLTGDDDVGVFPKTARINHSCRPNAGNWWSEKKRRRTIYAAVDIQSGQEITVSYIPLLKPTSERHARLAQYGFTCDCDACGSRDSDARRVAIGDAMAILEAQLPLEHVGAAKTADLTTAAIDLVELVEAEGLIEYYARSYRLAAEYHQREGRRLDAMGWASKELEMLLLAEEGSAEALDAWDFLESLE